MDLFGMYGSRSDDEPDDGADRQDAYGQALPDHDEAADRDDGVTQPIPTVAGEPDGEAKPAEVPPTLSPATAEQVAAYVAEIGTVIDESMLLRPYVRTGGRTRADADLAIEALVIGVPLASEQSKVAFEHRQVHALCTEPRSVAEVAAYSRLPIGSARVIIADMLRIGLLVQCSNEVTAGSPSMELMARVRDGLRNL